MTVENCTIPKLILGLPRNDFINFLLLVKLRNLYKMLKNLYYMKTLLLYLNFVGAKYLAYNKQTVSCSSRNTELTFISLKILGYAYFIYKITYVSN